MVRYEVGLCGVCGFRDSMEDEHWHDDATLGDGVLGVGIFDGHGGSDASIHVSRRWGDALRATPSWPGRPADALRETCVAVETEMWDDEPRFFACGTTALAALLFPDGRMVCANVGDTECLRIPFNDDEDADNDFVSSQTHRPHFPAEKARIEAANGRVVRGRINDGLSVSRSFGDFEYKSPKKPMFERMISCEPFVDERALVPGDLLVLACDGLWDFVTADQVRWFVRTSNATSNDAAASTSQAQRLADDLANYALDKGSVDNVSVFVVRVLA